MDLKSINECVELRKFWVRNFKSLRDVTLEFPTRPTIIVGTNGSGKTALVEAFELLTSTIEWAMGRTTNPFLKWWGYDKVVWRHDENTPIILGLELEYKDKEECLKEFCKKPLFEPCKAPTRISYEIYITGKEGRFQILKENFRAQGNGLDVSIDTDKGELTVTMSKETFEKIFKDVAPTLTLKSDSLRLSIKLKAAQEIKPLITDGASYFILFNALFHVFKENLDDFVKIIHEQTTGKKVIKRSIYFLLEYFADYTAQHLSETINMVRNFINNITVIKDIDWKTIRNPQTLTRQDRLMPDASNFVPFLYTITEGNVPESLVVALKYAFIGVQDLRLSFGVTEDGRVFLKLIADDVTLTPASIPSGVLKTLIIESLLHSGASLIVIDEFENSLHPELQQFLMDEFRSHNAFVILTTHSTVPLDYAKSVSEVVVLRLEGGETRVYRLKKEVEEELKRSRMTLSELFESGLLEPTMLSSAYGSL
ncbi:MAG: AAA family ATPase [Caldivirga sp.]